LKQQKKLAKKMLFKFDKIFGPIDYNENGGKNHQSNGQIQLNLFNWHFGQVRQEDKRTKREGAGVFWLIFSITMTMISCRPTFLPFPFLVL
jgi:hypothetical protein